MEDYYSNVVAPKIANLINLEIDGTNGPLEQYYDLYLPIFFNAYQKGNKKVKGFDYFLDSIVAAVKASPSKDLVISRYSQRWNHWRECIEFFNKNGGI
jgi:hypothetical protein